MLTLHPELITRRRQGKKAVLLPLWEWRRVMNALETLEEIRAYDRAKSRRERMIPFEKAVREIKAKASR